MDGVTPSLSFDFYDLNDTNTSVTTASDNLTKASLKNALIEGGFTGNAPRFQYTVKGGAMLKPGRLAALFENKAGYALSMWIMPYQSLHGAHYFQLLSMYGSKDCALLEMSYSSPNIRVYIKGSKDEEALLLVFPYTRDTLIPAFDATHTNDGVWQWITLSVDFVKNSVCFYVNGERVQAEEANSISFAYDALPVQTEISVPDCIGGDPQERKRSFNGIIDHVCFFDHALEEDEVQRLYASYGNSETLSVTEDHKLLRTIVNKLGSSLILKAETANLVCGGRVVKADVTDYTRTTFFQNGEFWVPSNLCERYFGTVHNAVLQVEDVCIAGRYIDGIVYFSIASICDANGWTFIKPKTEKGLYIMLAPDSKYPRELEAEALSRLQSFCEGGKNEPTQPIEQTRTVIATSDSKAGDYTYSPSITKLDGLLYASRDISCRYTEVFCSADAGTTWTYTGRVENMWWATLFEHNGALYLIGRYTEGGFYGSGGMSYIGITRSTDRGKTWTKIDDTQGGIRYDGGKGVHCAPTPVLKWKGRLYRAFEVIGTGIRREFLISADENADLLNPDSWMASDYFTGYGTPNEGNAVNGPDGSVWVLSRLVTNKAYVMKLDEEHNKLVATQETLEDSVINFPSTASKFTVRYDENTKKYVTIVNTQTDCNCDYQRNYLMLATSKDLINWEVIQTLLCDREIYNPILSVAQHAFQYVDWIFDDEDIVFIVRESAEDAKNFHDSNYLTFYRIKHYAKWIEKDEKPMR